MSQDQQSYMKIKVDQNKSTKEIFYALQEEWGSSALGYSQVAKWVNEFKVEGRG